jgi:hypothetical protein
MNQIDLCSVLASISYILIKYESICIKEIRIRATDISPLLLKASLF